MLRCDLVPAPAVMDDYDCRAECGRTSLYVLSARDYSYSYPCCSRTDCIEKVRTKMEEDIKRYLGVSTVRKFWPWRWFREDSRSVPGDPYLT